MATTERLVKTSKFLSYVLRHRPDAAGITLDREGWAEISALIEGAARAGKRLDAEIIREVVATNDKKRFGLSEDGLRIRAVQGHSTKAVDIGYTAIVPPEMLYHGTATRFLDSILEQGLQPRSRQFVHLSHDEETAVGVGSRHGKPVVLSVAAASMHAAGFEFFRAENGVWLTAHVPVAFITQRP